MWTYTTDSMDFVTVSTGLILPYWMGLPIRYIHIINSFRIICTMYTIIIFSIYIIKVADHPNKPLSSEEKNQHSKNAIVIILFEFLVFIFSYKNCSNLIFNEILFANLVYTLKLYIFFIKKT